MSDETPLPAVRRGRGRPPSPGRREQIVDAALEEFAVSGFRGSSLAAVAQRVGLSQQGLLHHFPSKEALLVAVIERRDEVDSAEFDDLGDPARLTEIVELNSARPGLVRLYALLSAEGTTGDHPAAAYFTDRFDRLRNRIADSLRDGRDGPLPSGATPEQAAALLTAAMDGLQLQWLYEPEAVDMPALVALLSEILRVGRHEAPGA
ncbi:TetR/AcrR family transcriptional regulator [Nocardiopsis nanhaiensis]